MSTAYLESAGTVKAPVPNQPIYVDGTDDFTLPMTYPIGAMVVLETPVPIPDVRGSMTNEQLRQMSKDDQPPQSWFDSEEEQLF